MQSRQERPTNIAFSPASHLSLNFGGHVLKDYISKGDACYQNGNYIQAIKMYRRAADLVAIPQVLMNLGLCLFENKDFDEALGAFEDAISLFERKNLKDTREYVSALICKGDTFAKIGQKEAALRCYAQALEKDAKAIDVWISKAKLDYSLGYYTDAIKAIQKVLHLDRNNIDYLRYALEISYYGLKNEKLVLGFIDQILKINNKDTVTLEIQKLLSDKNNKFTSPSNNAVLTITEGENSEKLQLEKKLQQAKKKIFKKPSESSNDEEKKVGIRNAKKRIILDPDSDEEFDSQRNTKKAKTSDSSLVGADVSCTNSGTTKAAKSVISKRIILDPNDDSNDALSQNLIPEVELDDSYSDASYNDDDLIDDARVPSSSGIYQQSIISFTLGKERVQKQVTFAPQLDPIQGANAVAIARIQSNKQLDSKTKDKIINITDSYFKKLNPSQNLKAKQFTSAANTMLGLWGEEAFYHLMLYKYTLASASISFTEKGFTAKLDTKKVEVFFPNAGQYDSYSDQNPPSAAGSVGKDFIRKKSYTDAKKPKKIDFFEVKTTIAYDNEASIISMTSNENKLMNRLQAENKQTGKSYSWNLIRFFSAGSNAVGYSRLKKVDVAQSNPVKFKL